MTSQQDFASEFEYYLLGRMTQMGMACTAHPVLKDGRTPDFLVEHEGRTCYVEATHIEGPDEFIEKRGEQDLRELLECSAPKGKVIALQYGHNGGEKLTNQISRSDRGFRKIVAWLSKGGEGMLRVEVKGIPIEVQVWSGPTGEESRAGWFKHHSRGGAIRERHKKLRDRLKLKYDKYSAEPESLGDIPLVVAIFDEMIDRQEMGEALYGTRLPCIVIDGEMGKSLEAGTKTIKNGVWLNSRSEKLEYRHYHLAGVWHFQAMKDPKRQASLFINPYREDLELIIPMPILKDNVMKSE